jgi:hypothetical protein
MEDKELFEKSQACRRADEVGRCFRYEAFQKIESASSEDLYRAVFLAFCYLGRIKTIWGKDYEEAKLDLYEKAKQKLLTSNFSEEELGRAAEEGLNYGEGMQLPNAMGKNAFHYGFVAEIFSLEYRDYHFGYTPKYGWCDIFGNVYEPERGLKSHIYRVMREKIAIWRECLAKDNDSVMGLGGWLEKLERNINDPDWLSKVEELLLRVDYFGVEIDEEEE